MFPLPDLTPALFFSQGLFELLGRALVSTARCPSA